MFLVLQEEKRKKREREQNESEAAAATSATSAGVPVEPFTLSKTINIGLEVSKMNFSKRINSQCFWYQVIHIITLFHQPEEKKKRKEREREFELESEVEFHPNVKVEIEQPGDRPVRACRTQQGKTVHLQVQQQINVLFYWCNFSVIVCL